MREWALGASIGDLINTCKCIINDRKNSVKEYTLFPVRLCVNVVLKKITHKTVNITAVLTD